MVDRGVIGRCVRGATGRAEEQQLRMRCNSIGTKRFGTAQLMITQQDATARELRDICSSLCACGVFSLEAME